MPTSPAIKKRPIVFSIPMVRAILEGKKTQFRLPIKPQPNGDGLVRLSITQDGQWLWYDTNDHEYKCPYGHPGDYLWVRESVRITSANRDGTPLCEPPVWYLADGECPNIDCYPYFYSAVQMPSWARRITVKIINIRAEWLQNISWEEALSEGVFVSNLGPGSSPIREFRYLWDSTYSSRGLGWDTNPWVWVIEFKIIEP